MSKAKRVLRRESRVIKKETRSEKRNNKQNIGNSSTRTNTAPGPEVINIRPLESAPANTMQVVVGEPIGIPIEQETAKKKINIDGILDAVGKGLSIAETVKDQLSGNSNNAAGDPGMTYDDMPAAAPSPKKWHQKTGAIVGMSLGGLALVGGIIYFATRKKP